MPSVIFETWWSEFQRAPDALDDPQRAARRIGRHLRSLPQDSQPEFLNALLKVLFQRQRRFGVALFMMEQIADPAALGAFAQRLTPLPPLQTEDEESHLADIVRILAAASDPDLVPVVETYLLERPIGPHWSSVPWAVWPNHRDVFGAAWTRFFQHQHPSIAESTLVIRAFLSEPGAIHAVRGRLAEAAPKRWDAFRDALLRQAGSVRWLDDRQREALDQTLA